MEAERLGEEQGMHKNIAYMATKTKELEAKLNASNEWLEAKIDASLMRLKAMFQQLLATRPPITCTPCLLEKQLAQS